MADERSFDVEWRPIEDVVPYGRNPRKFGDETIASVAASIRRFGWRQPIVVDVDGIIVAGHARYAAATSMGLDRVPVHVYDGDEKDIQAYRVADNKSGELAEWDIGKLTEELRELDKIDDLDMTAFGFTSMEMEMVRIDDEAIMNGRAAEPWGGPPRRRCPR